MSAAGGGGRPFAADLLTELFQNPLDPGYADAARRRERSGPRTGWRQRATRSVVLLVLTVLGFLLAVAYRQTLAAEPARIQTRAGMVEQVKLRQAQTDGMQRQAERLRGEVAALRDAALSGPDAARLRDLEATTGLAPVRGDGVVIRLADGPRPADAASGDKPNLGRVFDRDLQDLANELWAVGAEAVAINGQRLTATSTIRGAGEAVLVDTRPVMSPYEVSAIGPDDLSDRFGESSAARMFRRLVGEVGMSFQVAEADGVTLPAAVAPQLRHARTPPVPGPSGSTGSTAPGPGRSGPASPAASASRSASSGPGTGSVGRAAPVRGSAVPGIASPGDPAQGNPAHGGPAQGGPAQGGPAVGSAVAGGPTSSRSRPEGGR
ncbi:MAG TPA: DUF881 domain-containing protein [Catenuloplanes sp.]